MRIATWNVNGLRARLELVRLWLAERKPDLLALQELKLPDEAFPHDVFAELGYRAVSHGQKSWNGVAILSRGELEVTQRGLPGQDELGARLITARCAGLSFASVYCPNGKHLQHEDFARKLAWFDALASHLAQRHAPQEPLVLGGDFNVCPTPLDTWNEAELHGGIFHTDAERQRMQALAGWGLTDLFRRVHPETQAFSWWDYRGGAFHRRQGLRIDFLLATAPVSGRVQQAEIDRDYRKKREGWTPSDHAPVWADLG